MTDHPRGQRRLLKRRNIRLIFSYRGTILRTCLSLLKNRSTCSRHILQIVANRLSTSFSSRNQASSLVLYSLNRLSAFLVCFHNVLMSTKDQGKDEQPVVESHRAASHVIELPNIGSIFDQTTLVMSRLNIMIILRITSSMKNRHQHFTNYYRKQYGRRCPYFLTSLLYPLYILSQLIG